MDKINSVEVKLRLTLYCIASYGKTGQLLRVSGAAVPFRTVRSTAMLARSATGEVNTVIYLYLAC